MISRRHLLRALPALAVPASLPLGYKTAVADTFVLRLGIADPATSVLGSMAIRFAAAVERRSRGNLKVEVYPNGQIAKQQQSIDGLTTGLLDMTIQTTGYLTGLLPRYQVLDMPFLFKSIPAAFRVLAGPLGSELFADLEPKGMTALGWGTGGFKEIDTTSKAIAVPADMKGLRIRVLDAPVYVSTCQAMGAIPVAVDQTEVFTALSQKTIDGVDYGVDLFTAGKYYTVMRHVALTNHVMPFLLFVGGKRKIDALPLDLNKILREEARAIVAPWQAAIINQGIEDIKFLKSNGVAFSTVDYGAFRKAMDPVYAQFGPRIGGDLLDRMIRAANAAGA